MAITWALFYDNTALSITKLATLFFSVFDLGVNSLLLHLIIKNMNLLHCKLVYFRAYGNIFLRSLNKLSLRT